VPRVVAQAMIEFVGFFFREKKKKLRSIYWKLAEDNVYSSQAIHNLGFEPAATLFDLNSQQSKRGQS